MSILTKIIETKKEEVKKLHTNYNYSDFEKSIYFFQKCYDFKSEVSSKRFTIISEIKKASPSKGILIDDFNPSKIAEIYTKNGANAISILTDEKYFQGSINYLSEIAETKSIPLLRKDFIIDEFQILQAKSNGADVILLICEALTKLQISDLLNTANEIGLSVLIECHSENELDKLDFTKDFVLGINNRDLKTFNVDINRTIQIKKVVPEKFPIISESGISKKEHIKLLKGENINGILIGEHLMKSSNIAESLISLRKWCDED